MNFLNLNECCKAPFARFIVNPFGECWICCPSFLKKRIGNLKTQTFEEIWYGKEADEYRKSVLDGSYSLCDMNYCRSKLLNVSNDVVSFRPPYPLIVSISYDKVCNVRCITCRDEPFCVNGDYLAEMDMFYEKLIPVLKSAKIIYLNGGGEVFVSNHLKKLINYVPVINPQVKYDVISNGILFDEKHCREFGLWGKMNTVQISLHSATKKTYDKIVRDGDFNRVMKNLRWLSLLKKNGEISCLDLMFVIHSMNYREMVLFAKMAKKLGARVIFTRYRNWFSSEMGTEFDKYAIWEKTHIEHKSFLKQLRLLKKYENCYFDDALLMKLQNGQPYTFWDRVKGWFC